jgi:dCMP deaminase
VKKGDATFSSLERPSWEEYFLRIAADVATRSTCLRRHVGALLVLDKRILATGYNGAPSGLPHCSETGCIRHALNVPSGERHELCRGLHAEMNVLLQAAKYGIQIGGSTLYCTNTPCSLCAKMLINGDIHRIVVLGSYPDKLALEMLSQAGVELHVADMPQPSTEQAQPAATGRRHRREKA